MPTAKRRVIPKILILREKRRNTPGSRRDKIDFGCIGASRLLARPIRSVEQEKDAEKFGEDWK